MCIPIVNHDLKNTMAHYKDGINGPFYGKVGSVIGSRWKGIDYIKGLPKLPTKPPTQKQLESRARFAFVNAWMQPIKPFLNIGFMNYSDRMTAQNAAHSVNKAAVTGEYPNFGMDHTQVLVSHGDLAGVDDPLLVTQPDGRIELSWKALKAKNEEHSDQMLLLIYSPEMRMADFKMGEAYRMAQGYAFQLDKVFKGKPVFIYLAFASLDRRRISISQYLGEVVWE